MVKTTLNLIFFAIIGLQSIIAQNIKDETLEYKYIKLPLTPLSKSITNYQSTIFAPYEAENKKKLDQYELDKKAADVTYEKDKQDYAVKLKAAQDTYAAEMAAWEKKSMAEKVIEKQVLNENNKPVLHAPSQPYLHSVEKPILQTSYDYPSLASTYLILDGYNNQADNAVKIEVTIYGFDYTHPRQLTEVKDVASSVNGVKSVSKVTYYHIEFSYRHTMSIKVTGPDGKEIFNLTPQELNTYKIYKTGETNTSQSINEEMLVKMHEEKILQENLTFINNLVNDKIGFKRETRKTSLSYVKTKDDIYTDLLVAYNDAIAGTKLLVDDNATAKTKIQGSIDAWTNALKESDLNDRKARIDKHVTLMIYFNLLEAYFAVGDIANYEKIITTLNTLPISATERKLKESYEAIFNDLKKRKAANQ